MPDMVAMGCEMNEQGEVKRMAPRAPRIAPMAHTRRKSAAQQANRSALSALTQQLLLVYSWDLLLAEATGSS